MNKLKSGKKILFVLLAIVIILGVILSPKIITKGKSTINKINIELTIYETKQLTNSNWNNKTWHAVGDSITGQNIYPRIVAKSFGLTMVNYGIPSSTLAVNNSYLKGESVYERTLNYPNADLWTIFAGVNDWLYKTPISTIDSTDPKTFYGALKGIVINIKDRPNHPNLILITPLQSVRNGENDNGVPMQDYRQAIINVGKLYNVPVLDLYKGDEINSDNLKEMTIDGIHPSLSGTKLYAPKIIDAIQSLK